MSWTDRTLTMRGWAAALALLACDPRSTRVTPPDNLAVVQVSPEVALLTSLGETRSLSPEGADSRGLPVALPAVSWSSGDEGVVTVDAAGVVTAVGEGTADVEARVGALSATARVLVQLSATPPVLLVGGHVLTMDPVTRVEEGIVILGERIVATGSSDALRAMVGVGALVRDIEGRTVMPGFVDPHNHVFNAIFLGSVPEEVGTSYAEAQARLIAAGTTTMANGNVWPSALADFLPFAESAELRLRASVYLGLNDFCGGPWPDGWHLEYPPRTDPEARFRIPGVKIFTDGGACNIPAVSYLADSGDLYLQADSIVALVRAAEASGYQALIHALGDIAVDVVHDAMTEILAGGPNHWRHRMDHNRYVKTHQLARYGQLGVLPVVFGNPFTCRILDGAEWSFLMNDTYAPFRPRFDRWRDLLDANPGLTIAWKSDSPGLWPLQPIGHLWGLVTRDEARADGSVCEAPAWLEAGAVTVQEALQMMTVNAAYVLGMDSVVGSLADGKFADLIVLSDNPLAVAPAALRTLEVQMTMIGGIVEHCATPGDDVCLAEPPSAT